MQLFLLVISLGITAAAESTVEYYKRVWNENLERIKAYKRPTRSAEFENYRDTNINIGSYDFIIVGAGSSGSVLAARLSEITNWKILLLEAGGDETDFSQIPGAFFPIQQTELNWGYLTTPQQKACYGCVNNQCDYGRGKVLGGCSATNAMLYVRGNRGDFDDWCARGNKGWCYEDVLKYFKKLENASAVTDGVENHYRGVGGPLSVTFNSPAPSYSRFIVNAAREISMSDLDYNAERQLNVVERMQVTVKDGRRHSANQAYLQPALGRENLRVLTKALAVKIVALELTPLKKAKQVKFIQNGKSYLAYATKEVIVSAGAVNSPQLLMLSGIGPKTELAKHGIESLADLPVGENLEDHPTIFNVVIKTNLTFTNQTLHELFTEYASGRGSLTHTYGHVVQFNYAKETHANGIPDVEYIFFQANAFHRPEWTNVQSNFAEIMRDSLQKQQLNSIFVNIMLLHPKSRGWVKLNSSSPLDHPLINPNYLDDEDDTETLINAVTNLELLLATPTFKSINAEFAPSFIKPCETLQDRSYWECVVRHKLQGIYHPVSTCRMGAKGENSVVDSNLIVHGFKNLRVVDASVFPTSTSGHPNAVCIMIAEKMADEIKRVYNKITE